MGRKKDRFWEYAEELEDGFKCHFCKVKFSGGVSRIKSHLAKVTGRDIRGCTAEVPEEVQSEAYKAIGGPNKKVKGVPSTSNFEQNKTISASSSSPSNTLSHNKDKSAVDKLLAKHVVLNNIPIDVVQTASFSRFVQGVAEYGHDYRLPSDSTLKTKLIPDLRIEVEDYVKNVKKSWVKTGSGCTLMLDLWGDKRQGDFIGIIAYSPKGVVFMNSFEIPNERKEELNLTNIVSSVIEEIGPYHVVQFITNVRKFESVGDKLVLRYPQMYKTPCAAQGIHLLLKDIYEEVGWVQEVIDDANVIVNYWHKNTTISSLLRKHTNNKELKRSCLTRFASNFLMLQSIFNVKEELQSKWRELDCNEEDMAERVTSIIESTKFWSEGQEVLEIFKPLVRVLQLAETDGSTSGYLYEAMERAKRAIKQLCDNNQAKHKRIWELLEERHFENIVHPIHAAAAFLNPAYMCSDNFREDDKMRKGMDFILESLVADEEKEAFTREMNSYSVELSSLFTTTATLTLKTSHPWIWWHRCGHTLPVLRKYAIRILSQPCSSSSCRRNWSVFEAVQTEKKNKLAAETLDNIVYVRMNAMIMEKSHMMEAQRQMPIDLDHLSELLEYPDHEQSWEDDDAFDDIDENLDKDTMNELPEYVDQLSELPERANHEQDWEDDVLDAIDEDLDKQPEYADREENCDDDAFDGTDKDIHGDIINDTDPSCLEEIFSYQMENVGESIVSALLPQLFDKLNSPELQEFAHQKQVNTELKKWETFLQKIYAVLDDANKKQMADSSVRIWLSKLTDLAYDVEDILDEIRTTALRHKLMVEPHASTSNVWTLIPASSSSLNPSALNFNVKMRSEIDEITSRLQEIVAQKDNLNLREKAGRRTNKLRGRPPTASLVDKSHVYGREKDKESILELVLRDEVSDNVVCVIPIIGMGGVGKTTLAQLVYNDGKVNDCFDLKVWVYVSKEFNVLGILITILQAVTSETKKYDCLYHLDLLQFNLKRKLSGKKFLLVLDDISKLSCDQWYVLHRSIMEGAVGSKIVVTTRDESVASTMGSFSSYLLKELSFDDCLSLFAHHALGTELFDGHSNLKVIGEKIVRRCKGLPLAVKTLGGLLHSKLNCDDWEDILNSKIWDFSRERSAIFPALILSYHHLPSYLKRCFAYCAIFPKGYEFDKDELVLLWMAEGFLQEREGKKHMEDLGHEYFLELLSRSFFQQSSGNKSRFVMHDLINDLAKFVAGEICFNLEGDTLDKNFEKIRHSSFHPCPYDVSQRFEVFYRMKGLRTLLASPLLVPGYSRAFLSKKVLRDLIPKLGYLRELSLTDYEIREIPVSIGDLKHLRFLNFSYSTIKRLPESMSALLNLQTLILRGCKELTMLPEGIGNLIELHHLDITGTRRLHEIPSGIANLTNLQTLSKFIVKEGDGGLRVKDLKNLSHLRGQLSILNLHNVVDTRDAWDANLKEKEGLDELVLRWWDDDEVSEGSDDNDEVSEGSDDNDEVSEQSDDDEMKVLDLLQPHINLKKLTITSYGSKTFPSWIGDPIFFNLVQMDLHYCEKSTLLPSLGKLPSLKTLSIKGMDAVKAVGVEFYGVDSVKAFPSLESLSFEDMRGWKEWLSCTTDEVEDVFPCLRKLVIQNCPKLNVELLNLYVAPDDIHISTYPRLANSFVRLPSLHELQIGKCNVSILMSLLNLTSLTTLKIGEISGLASLDMLAQLVALEVVEIENCSELMYLWEYRANLARLKKLVVTGCSQLVYLAGEEGGLHSLTCLRSLSIRWCPKLVSFPATGLPYTLKRLELLGCGALVFWPDHGMTIHGGNSNQCFLEELVISSCPSLKSFPREMLPTTLKKLEITWCKNLESLPEGMMLDECFLEELVISSCPSLKSFPREMLPTTLKKLNITWCKNLESLPEGMMLDECFLEELVISSCPLKSFPREMLPTTLKKLKITHCENLVSLPEGMMLDDNNSNNTSHLKSLQIIFCTQLKSLSEWILLNNTSLEVIRLESCHRLLFKWPHRLTHLRELAIINCPTLESFPDLGFSIPNLKSLVIKGCDNLMSLPNQMYNFTSLQELDIQYCKEIVSFPEGGLPPNLTSLVIKHCGKMKQSMSEWGLHRLSSLRQLRLAVSCPTDMASFPDDDCSMFPKSLTDIQISWLENLESISSGIKNLTSLEKLGIWNCPNLHSLPKDKEDLPASLGYLWIWKCPLLTERCLKENGEYWPIISHIPCVEIDGYIQ